VPNAGAHVDFLRAPNEVARAAAGADPSAEGRVCPAAATTARSVLRTRRLRDRWFGGELFRDPAWDILLDLYAAAELGRKISVSSACGASGVPAATALRVLAKLEKMGAIVRVPDDIDGRTVHLELTPETLEKMTGLLERLAAPGSN